MQQDIQTHAELQREVWGVFESTLQGAVERDGRKLPLVTVRGEPIQGSLVNVAGEHYYFAENDVDGAYLTKQLLAVDAGDNVVETRSAPASPEGMAWVPNQQPRLQVIGGEPVFWVK